MPSISQAVRSAIEAKPMLYDALYQGIVNHASLAEKLQHEIEQDVGKEVHLPAIVMAIRRYSEKLKPHSEKKIPFMFNSEIILKTGLVDITLVKNPSSLAKLRSIYNLMDFESGETLNIIQGNYEVTVVISDKYAEHVKKIFKGETVLNVEKDLVSLTMTFSKEFLYTPGILAKVTRELSWENINVYENISTMTELIYIVQKKEAIRAYKVLQHLIDHER